MAEGNEGGGRWHSEGGGTMAYCWWGCRDSGAVGFEQRWSVTREASRNGAVGRRLYGTGARGCAARSRRMAATRREHADRQAQREKRRLIGGSLMSVISELKFTPG
jgi:hypothetical protein